MSRRSFFALLIGLLPLALIPTVTEHKAVFGPQASEFTKPVSQSVTIVVEGSVIGTSPEMLARELEALLEPDDVA